MDLSRRLEPDNGSFLHSQPPGVGTPSPPPRATVMDSAGPNTSSPWLATRSPLPTISLQDLKLDLDPNQILTEMGFDTRVTPRTYLSMPCASPPDRPTAGPLLTSPPRRPIISTITQPSPTATTRPTVSGKRSRVRPTVASKQPRSRGTGVRQTTIRTTTSTARGGRHAAPGGGRRGRDGRGG